MSKAAKQSEQTTTDGNKDGDKDGDKDGNKDGNKGGNKGGNKVKSVSKSTKAGLTFPVARINRFMKLNSPMKRIGGSAPVYMTAIVEYVTAELMELAGNNTKKAGRKTATPDDLTAALRGDPDLAKVFAGHGIFIGNKINNISETIKYKPTNKPTNKTKKAVEEA